MTTLDVNPIIDVAETPEFPSAESIWSRVCFLLQSYLARACEYLNEDMGQTIIEDGKYYPTGGCCCP